MKLFFRPKATSLQQCQEKNTRLECILHVCFCHLPSVGYQHCMSTKEMTKGMGHPLRYSTPALCTLWFSILGLRTRSGYLQLGGVPEQTVATPIKSVPPRKVSHVCRAHHVKVAPDISQSDISSYTSWMSEGHCAAQGDAGTARADAL